LPDLVSLLPDPLTNSMCPIGKPLHVGVSLIHPILDRIGHFVVAISL
jgi:hypothetical protein